MRIKYLKNLDEGEAVVETHDLLQELAIPKRNKDKLHVGVIGIGSVGGAISHCLKYFHTVVEYDKYKELGEWWQLLDTDAVCVCVPSDLKEGRLDMSAMDEVLERLHNSDYEGVVIIKTTLQVGYCDKAVMKHPNLRIVYTPEYLRERSAFIFASNPDRTVIAGKSDKDIELAIKIFSWQESPIIRMSYIDAEISKLAHNAFIAVKVSFTNEIASICEEYFANPENVMLGVASDRRIAQYRLNQVCGLPNLNEIHMNPDGSKVRGKCVPKDTSELVNASKNAPLLKKVIELNEGS